MQRFIDGLEWLVTTCGRSAAYVAVGVLEIVLAYKLAQSHPDALSGFATALGAVNLALYGGGAVKAFSDAKAAILNGGFKG